MQPAGIARDVTLLAGRWETGVKNKGRRADGEVNLKDKSHMSGTNTWDVDGTYVMVG